MASNNKRKRRQRRIPRAEVTSARLNSPAGVGAFLQEIKAGAAPLTSIVAVPAEVAAPSGYTVATVPFLTTPLIPWNKVTTGDPLLRLVQLLQDRGGLWLARHTVAVVDWTVGPTQQALDTRPSDAPDTEQPDVWVRADFTITGAWNGKFALTSPADKLATNLWCLAASPVIGVLPDEAASKALPTGPIDQPVAWNTFTQTLDNTLHITTSPSETVRRLVVASAWPGADKLVD